MAFSILDWTMIGYFIIVGMLALSVKVATKKKSEKGRTVLFVLLGLAIAVLYTLFFL